MGLSTHVLDTMHGCPAAGMAVELYATQGAQATLVKKVLLNADGRPPDGPLYKDGELGAGTYRLVFEVAASPWVVYSATSMPAAGPPCIVSST